MVWKLLEILTSVGNAECINLWRDRNYEPFLHFVHVSYTVGMLAATCLGAQLLPDKSGIALWDPVPQLTGLQTYFAIMGACTMALTPLYLFFGLRDTAKYSEKESSFAEKAGPTKSPTLRLLVFAFVLVFFAHSPLFIMGQEVTIFGALSHLDLSSAESAHLSSLYMAGILFSRIFFIILSVKVRSKSSMHFLLVLSGAPCLYALARQASLSLHELQVCLVLASLGAGPVVSLNMVWFEDFAPVDASASGLFLLGHSLGLKIWAPTMGVLMESDPFVLFWVAAAAAAACLAFYVGLAAFSDHIKNRIVAEQLDVSKYRYTVLENNK